MGKSSQKIIKSLNKKEIAPKELSEVILTRLCSVLSILSIITIIISIPLNIVFRIPDSYSYEVKENNLTKEYGNLVNEDKVSKEFSNFFLHKSDSIEIFAEYNSEYGNVFTKNDVKNLKEARTILDIDLIICLGMSIVLLFCIIYLFYKRRKKTFFICTGISTAIIFIYSIYLFIKLIVYKGGGEILKQFLHISFKKDSFVTVALTKDFSVIVAIYILIISAILLGVLISFCAWQSRKK